MKKKLFLNKSIVSNLTNSEKLNVKGGVSGPAHTCADSCNCTNLNTKWDHTCMNTCDGNTCVTCYLTCGETCGGDTCLVTNGCN